jgi:phage terminase large subunit-like protein
MSAIIEPVRFEEIRSALLSEKAKRKAERSLAEFCRQAWPIIEPGVPFIDGWHIEVICNHLEAVTRGEIKRLLINIPPRTSKSSVITVMWPCWEWIEKPSQQYLCASYSGVLSIRDNLKARRIIQSAWYRRNWGERVQLSGDQNQKTRFENTAFGHRIATSVGGTATGEGGSRIIIDDPHSATEAQSDVIRESAIDWLRFTMSTRLNTPKHDAIVIVMQRLHEDDASGYVMKQGGYEHVCLPMRYELDEKGNRRTTILGDYDIRKTEGQLLLPSRFGEPEVLFLERELGEYGTAGQLQQRPAPAGGGILKTKYLKLWRAADPLPQLDFILQSYDTAFTEDPDNDYTACVVFGIFWNVDKQKNCALILDAWNDHLAYPNLRKKVIDDWRARYGGDDNGRRGRRADAILVEEKASGISLLQDLRLANIPAAEYNPGRADKAQRAHLSAPLLELEVFYVLESTKRPNEPISWAVPMIEQMSKFPAVKKKDFVDAFTQGCIYIKDQGLLELPEYVDPDDDPKYADDVKRKRRNPYD